MNPKAYFHYGAVCLALCASVLFSNVSSAQETDVPEYRVEIIVVRNLNPVSGTEIWPMDESRFDPSIPAERFTRAEAADLELGDMVNRLNNSKNFRVISHTGWVQPGYARDDARRKVFLRRAATGESVSGDFLLSRERYLRLEMDLTIDVDGQRFKLSTARRMLSRRTHYFDHPYFGVIARITPL